MKNSTISREECRLIQLDILSAISKICKENNLNYTIAYGSLIGAKRHGGFIPWDDDIDIVLLRKDYDELIRILKHQNEHDWLSILDITSEGYYYPFAKAVNNQTIAKMEDNITPHGIWVDIFPYDMLPENSDELRKFQKKCRNYRAIILSMTTDFTGLKVDKKYILKRILSIYAHLVGKEKIVKKYQNYVKAHLQEKSKYVGCVFSTYSDKECFPIEWFSQYETILFEGRPYMAIKNSDEYLRSIYGEYMTIPPEEKRRDHRIIATSIK